MKITLNEIRGMEVGLQTVMSLELPPKTAYKFKRLMDRIVSELRVQEKEINELGIKYAKKDKDGKPIFKKDKDGKELNQYDPANKDDLMKYMKEFGNLTQKEIDLPVKPINLEEFGDTKVKPDTLYQLGKLIKE